MITNRLLSFLTTTVLAVSALANSAHAATYTVTTLSDNYTTPPGGSLRAAINQANADPASADIVFSIPGGGTIHLAANAAGARMLPILANPNGISIDGANGGQGAIIIDGGSTSTTTGDRIFFVGIPANTPATAGGNLPSSVATSFSIVNLTLRNGNARGGNGGTGEGGGGAGAGLGGAIFLNAGNLSLSNVIVSGSRAVGGTGGAGSNASGKGGGGGMGGAGGAGSDDNSRSGGGGGGFGIGANGGFTGAAGSGGSFSAAIGGGSGSDGGGAGGASGGGGGAGGTVSSNSNAGGGGGVGGQNGSSSSGRAGGFGGGGGAHGNYGGVSGSAGGFGGGGSSGDGDGGGGGFGGGGGGTAAETNAGSGGFGAGTGGRGPAFPHFGSGGGGGGLGAGGAIFVRQGATLTVSDLGVSDVGFSGNSVTAGAGGAGYMYIGDYGTPGTPGSAIGRDIFLAGSVHYYVATNSTTTLAVANTFASGTDAQITGDFTKTGGGTLTLDAANSHTGGTIVDGGTLLVNTSGATGSGSVTVNTGATLGGTGPVSGAITVNNGGIIDPGAGPGIFNSGNVNFASGSIFSVEINGTNAGSQHDQLNVTGTVTLDKANLSFVGTYVLEETDSIIILNNDGTDPIIGTFADLPEGSNVSIGGVARVITYIGGTGNDIALIPGVILYVQSPPGTNLVDGASTMNFGLLIVGSNSAAKTIAIVNDGGGHVSNLVATTTGANPSDFSIGALSSTSLYAGDTATFPVTFSPTGSFNRSATIQISGDSVGGVGTGNWTFTISLSGQSYHTQDQYDASRAAGVSDVTNDPNAYGLYTASQVQALNVGVPLLERNPTNGLFTLLIKVEKSTNNIDFLSFPLTAPQTTINADGELEFNFSTSDNAAFFRLLSK